MRIEKKPLPVHGGKRQVMGHLSQSLNIAYCASTSNKFLALPNSTFRHAVQQKYLLKKVYIRPGKSAKFVNHACGIFP
jgi:hypothetical protein